MDGPLDQFYDYRLSNHTMGSLRLAQKIGKPFFVMAGFRRPHRVFQVARRFWDLYPEDTSAIKVAKVQTRDASQPEIAFHHGDFTLANGSYWPGNADLPWPIEVQQLARKGGCPGCQWRMDGHGGRPRTLDFRTQCSRQARIRMHIAL